MKEVRRQGGLRGSEDFNYPRADIVMFDLNKPIMLKIDASSEAIGECISQTDEQGRLHPMEEARGDWIELRDTQKSAVENH